MTVKPPSRNASGSTILSLIDSGGDLWTFPTEDSPQFERIHGEVEDCKFFVINEKLCFMAFVTWSGDVYGLGDNREGQLSGGACSYHWHASKVGKLKNILQLSLGESFTLAVDSDGVLWGCGDNVFNQLEAALPTVYTPKPVFSNYLPPIQLITAYGKGIVCAIDFENGCWQWGGSDFNSRPKRFELPFIATQVQGSSINTGTLVFVDQNQSLLRARSFSEQFTPFSNSIKNPIKVVIRVRNPHALLFTVLCEDGTFWMLDYSPPSSGYWMHLHLKEPVIDLVGRFFKTSQDTVWAENIKVPKTIPIDSCGCGGQTFWKYQLPFTLPENAKPKKSARTGDPQHPENVVQQSS